MPTNAVPLRVVLVAPPASVPWVLQVGRDGHEAPRAATAKQVVLETSVTFAPARGDGAATLRGPAVQGPPAARFLYACSGKRAGDPASPWERRAKIPLAGITPALVAECQRTPGSWLEARVAGTSRDGGPACASVPLLDGGWRVVTER
jgi:Family of unknown function (DUF5990)